MRAVGDHIWRLSKDRRGLGMSCAEDGLFLGATPLLERRNERFLPRPQGDLERILSRGYGMTVSLARAMSGLVAVASALNAGELCRASIAAVHLRLPDLPDVFARIDMQLEDIGLSLDRMDKTTAAGDWNPGGGGWNPDDHPRTGTAPNPGWFAPKDGGGAGDGSARPMLVSDETSGDGRLHLPPGERNDEIGDLLEWIANAKPEDAQAISKEIKRVFFDAGDFNDGAMFQHALGEVLRSPDQATRQSILDTYEPITHHDPTEIGQINSWLDDAALGHFPLPDFLAPGSRAAESTEEMASAGAAGAEEAASEFWKLGWALRGQKIEEALTADMRGTRLPNFPVIDFIGEDGVVTSIKSIDLNAATYQDAGRLTYRINNYIGKLAEFDGASYGKFPVQSEDIAGRILNIAVPRGSMTAVQKTAIDAATRSAKALGIVLKITPF